MCQNKGGGGVGWLIITDASISTVMLDVTSHPVVRGATC